MAIEEVRMDFGDQIRDLRRREGLTQEQLAQRLMVTRQAVSNWERGSNLPDIETLIRIATTFDVSLDRLILGREGNVKTSEKNVATSPADARDEAGADGSRMARKLIRDGSEVRRARMNVVSLAIGCALILLGAFCVFVKANSVEYVDASGILHENFFLLPMAAAFVLAGLVTIVATGVVRLVRTLRDRRR
jgi:transcriptional regulator with XRE-family HTH domain